MKTDKHIDYFMGNKLRGDNFTYDQIKEWFLDEEEGYANLGAKEKQTYNYVYHELNKKACYKFIKKTNISKALGIGSAYGDEFLPLIKHIDNITILDPSESFSTTKSIEGVPCQYVKPEINGTLTFDDNEFDLIVAFAVFHHIPNVSYVLKECHRVLKSNGQMVIREPIVSMGDWTKKRKGLTKNERGIPYNLFYEIVDNAGFRVKKSTLYDFPIIAKIFNKFGIPPFTNKGLTKIDFFLSKIFRWNINYHPKTILDKLRPASLALVLIKK